MANEEGAIGQEPNCCCYDVFLCYRETDTRYTFTSTLRDALERNRIRTFMHRHDYDGSLKTRDQVSHAIHQAIQASRISIVVLSKHFASSPWCLDDLVNILHCKKTVVPVFYDVTPSDVWVPDDMLKHSQRFHLWELALSQVANLPGWHFNNRDKFEYELIQEIVEWVYKTMPPYYDVFLSFGKDTHYSFTGFLYNSLSRGGFKTFMRDDEGFQDRNQLIPQSIVEAIQKSRLSIIVFSENYAYSSSCLDELVAILECMEKKKNFLVWPIFYKVQPSDLRNLRNSYGKAMSAHEDLFGKDSEKVQKWRSALSEVVNLKGWHLQTGYEYEFIGKIVEIAMKV